MITIIVNDSPINATKSAKTCETIELYKAK